ncbi:CshA/CshB family fibrillar adhesin-related protein [Streptococcus sanguinis]|uniref:CshA/CshB family fibrillar adhesin-related protein n=2 Tax=Streptococcus sanguinis TaxID=1305 RepID=UPI00228536BF|nr:CshA/CshB family fibrillar adhesin-related protein [Streptococcus sanguinis]MCY7021198.1 CshA/CshB family fibrillar adhesin-related protein [Streptococcus sanguinis]
MGKDLFNPHLRKFSIRKLNVGVCSVLLSTLLLLGAAAQVSADEASDSGAQNEVSQTGIAESSVNSAETVASEHLHAKESSALPFATDTSQSDDNPSPRSSDSEKVEEPTESTTTKPVENTQPITVQPETSNAAVVAEKSEATADLAQPNRSRRVRRDATPTGQQNSVTTGVPIGTGPAGADDATSTPRVPKPSLEESVKKDSTQLAKQITWLDFSDTASWKGLDPRGGLQVGTTFKKEISPGYEVTLTVTELKPFNSTETYRKRVEGTPTANTYDPNAQNGYLKSAAKYGQTPPSVTGAIQNQWTAIRDQGFNTQGRKTQLVYPENSTNWGVKFNIEATYLGKRVAPTVVMADGEDANPGEFAIFTTNGEGWEYLGEWKNKSTAKEAYTVITKQMLDDENVKRRGLLILRDTSVDWYKYLSPDTVTGGLGTQVFGPNRSNERTVPVVMTRGASEVGFYVASSGQQAMMMGFLVVDGSDAPATYGEAFHTISGRDSLTGKLINQPYLGTTPADIDVESSNDWVLDDKKEHKDEGASQLLADDQLSNSNDLLDLDKAKNGTYTIKIKANPNGNAKSYVKAWIDFNNDGVFNESEGSNLQEITAAGDYTLTFNANPNISGGQVDKLGMRFRIATNKGDIEQPTGIAFSGEVEDMLLHRIYPPKGEKQTTDGFTGETQTAVLHFTPKGTDRSDYSVNAVMSTQAPQVLDKQGNALTPVDGNYIRPEGTYRLTVNGNDVQVVFTPNAEFSGIADGINIRWTDSNGTSTGWTSTDASNPNKNDQLTTMDGRYVPTVRKIPNYESSGLQGLEQNKTLVFNDDDANTAPLMPDATHPAIFVDANGQTVAGNTVPAMSNGQQVGTYELDPNTGQVTFKPIKTFYGTPDPVVVQVSDTDGKAHRARYQPNVTQVTPRSTDVESTGLQGQAQSGKPTFTPGDQQIPIDMSKAMTFENGTNTLEVANEGTYTINSDDTISFKPLKQFTGKATPVTVKRVDTNGTEVTATYTPNVTKVTPTSTPAISSGPQGVPQTGTPVFKEGDPAVPIDYNKQMTFDDGQPKKTVAGVGEYTINSDGSITFTPDKKYVGTPAAVTVKRVDENGTEVRATYTPTVTEVTPRSTNAVSSGLQGQQQSGKPIFTPGDQDVPIDMAQPMTFENGTDTLVVADQGIYTINSDGSITFKPEKKFTGKATPVKVKRVDTNGTEVTATYTPTVEEVIPNATGDQTEGPQGLVQNGKITFEAGRPEVGFSADSTPVFDTGTNVKEIENVGKFEVDIDGNITFTPVKTFVGKTPEIEVSRADVNGTIAKAKYQATVTAVKPTGVGNKTEGLQGQVQEGKVTFTPGHDSVPFPAGSTPLFDNHSTVKEVQNVGKFEVDSDGKVTFTPVKQFKGETPELELTRTDANGTPVTVKYQAVVKEVVPRGTDATSTGPQGVPQTGSPSFQGGDPLVPIDMDSPMTFEDGQPKKTVQGVGEYTINSDGTITFTPDKQYVGTPASVTVKRVDKNGTEVTATYTPTVTRVTPTSTNAESTGIQGQPQSGKPTFSPGDQAVPIDMTKPMTFENGTDTLVVANQGTYTINSDGSITFKPEKKFTGKATPVTVKRVDANGTEITATYTPTVTKVTPTGTNAESTGIQGQPQNGTPTFTSGDSAVPIDMDSPMTFEDGQSKKTVQGVGEYTINSDGSVTFTPEKQYIGTPTPVTVKRVDKNGTEVTASYTPTVTKITPTGTNATSTGPQGVAQTGTPTFQGGDPLVPIDDSVDPTFEDGSKEKKIPGQGTYTIAPDGAVTFTPEKQFVGKPDSVTVKRVDKNGTPVTATYSPEFTKVTPTGTGTKTEGLQGQVQEGKVTFTPGHDSVPFPAGSTPLFDNGSSVKEVPNVGKFEVDADGKVTFTPDKQFKGETPELELTRTDANGTPVTVKYQAAVKEVIPTGINATSTGPQGVAQTGTPTFADGDPLVPIDETVEPSFEDGTKKKTIPGQGTYTIAPDGAVTFTPDKQFVGKPDSITVKRVDKNGTPVTATYSPEFTKVTPTGTGAKTEGLQGQVQEGKVSFTPGHDYVPFPAGSTPLFDNNSTVKEVPNVGKFEVDADGKVTFTPDKQFKGETPELELTRTDANGTPVTVKYQAVVKEVIPTSTNVTSTGPQGVAQTGTPTFVGGDPLVPIDDSVEPTFEDGSKEKKIPGQGTYTITPDGVVTFTPEKQFVGKPDPISVKRVDKNGTPVTATYSPEFTKVTPTGTNATSTGPQGLPQIGTPTFAGGDPLVPIDETVAPSFEDGAKEKVIPGQGTYTIAPDGSVAFTPDKQFVGKPDPVTVKRMDKNGTPMTATYSPEFTKVTPTGTGTKTEGLQGQVQEGHVSFTPGHNSVPFPAGSTPLFDNGSSVKEVPNVGKFEVDADGKVTFTPDKQFKGETAELELTRTDANGTPVTVKYQAVVKEVIPTSTNVTSTGPQGVAQTGTPTFVGGDPLVPIDDSVEPTFEDGSKEKKIPGQGTYTITPDGSVTFTPDKQFVGKPDPITVKRVDKNGTPVTATYSPEFAKVTPTGKDATSTNIKGHVQTGTPVFEAGDPLVPIDESVEPAFEDGSKEKTIPGQGTYTIAPDGTVTFTPEADFLGQGSGVTLVRRDKNGTSVTARYVPTVVEPSTSKDSVSSGRKGQAQTGTPTFEGAIDQAVAPTFADGSTEMVVPGEGTYRFNMLGAVTFVPEADFVGTARGVVVKRSDIYGNAVTATYTPTVLGSTATEDTGSTGLKGQPQTGKPIFEGDVDPTVPPTFEDGSTEKVVPGQGTYTIAPDGTVTFVPETGFVGQADGVTVIRKDRNGQTISAVYVPTVTENPVQPERTITPAPPSLSKSEGAKSLPKTGTEEISYLAASLLAGVSGLGLLGLEKRKKKSED